uniref:Uncharacterized protein n=1 Tax=Panagrellus redivivus TaxID=6233 RepID=A0A7E4V0X5_PANRE
MSTTVHLVIVAIVAYLICLVSAFPHYDNNHAFHEADTPYMTYNPYAAIARAIQLHEDERPQFVNHMLF